MTASPAATSSLTKKAVVSPRRVAITSASRTGPSSEASQANSSDKAVITSDRKSGAKVRRMPRSRRVATRARCTSS